MIVLLDCCPLKYYQIISSYSYVLVAQSWKSIRSDNRMLPTLRNRAMTNGTYSKGHNIEEKNVDIHDKKLNVDISIYR